MNWKVWKLVLCPCLGKSKVLGCIPTCCWIVVVVVWLLWLLSFFFRKNICSLNLAFWTSQVIFILLYLYLFFKSYFLFNIHVLSKYELTNDKAETYKVHVQVWLVWTLMNKGHVLKIDMQKVMFWRLMSKGHLL